MNKGGPLNKPVTDYTDEEIKKEILTHIELYDIYLKNINKFSITLDSGFRNSLHNQIVRFYPGDQHAIYYPDTKIKNLGLIGDRIYAYDAVLPTTEWVTETAYRAVKYIIKGEKYRQTKVRSMLNWTRNCLSLGYHFTIAKFKSLW
jgi:myosin-crossreactive antigen